MLGRVSKVLCLAKNPSCCMELSLVLVKHLAACSTIEPKTNHSFPVSSKRSHSFIDEVKWAIRMPSRFATRELALNYEEET